jgi:hypothetical protein
LQIFFFSLILFRNNLIFPRDTRDKSHGSSSNCEYCGGVTCACTWSTRRRINIAVLATCKLSPAVKCQSTNASPFALPPFIWLYALPTPLQYSSNIWRFATNRTLQSLHLFDSIGALVHSSNNSCISGDLPRELDS